MSQLTINNYLLNALIASLSFLIIFYFKESKADMKRLQIQLSEVQVQLKEIQTKEMQYVTELRVLEIIKEFHKNDLHNFK